MIPRPRLRSDGLLKEISIPSLFQGHEARNQMVILRDDAHVRSPQYWLCRAVGAQPDPP